MGSKFLEQPTICAAFQAVVAGRPDTPALRTLDDSVSLSWKQLDERVRRVAGGLAALGIGKGDTVAMLLPNTIECHIVDFAACHLGAVPYTIYNTSSPAQVAYQLDRAAARVVFTEGQFLAKVEQAREDAPQIEHLIDVANLDDLPEVPDGFDFDAAWQAVEAEDLVTMIFTSGTTGPPKGAQWSHRTIMSQLRSLDAELPMPREATISFLPMAHAGGRITSHYMTLVHGATNTVCPDMRELPKYLAMVRPDSLFAVPRLWEKFQVAIEGLIHQSGDETAQKCLDIGLRRVRAQDVGSDVPEEEAAQLEAEHAEALKAVQPILQRVGLDRLRSAFVGGAPCSPEVVRFLRAVGVPLLEAYGSTECSLNIFNRIDTFKTGTAGWALPDVELKVAEDGELLCRGPLMFVGYAGMDSPFDDEGWFATGDIVQMDDDGYVKVVDRKKEIIISSAGKNMSPANIESAIKGESSLIGVVVAIGDGRKYNTALLTLDPEAAPTYAQKLGVDAQGIEDIAAAPEIRAEIERAVEAGNQHLARVEQIRKWTLIPGMWLPDSEEMTPTMKLKRRNINSKYADEIEALYAD